jgi:membrane protease YdiL (CAAX protease family)
MTLFEVVFRVTRIGQLPGAFLYAIPFPTGQGSFVPVLLFFVVAYAFTWSLHGLIVLLHFSLKKPSKPPAPVLYFLGLGGPLIAALTSAYLFYGQAGVVDLLNGALNWNVGLVWYVLAIAPIGVIYLVSTVLCGLWQKKRVALFRKPSKGVLVLILSQVWVVIAEEFGWRGFALPHLQGLFGWIGAGLILGILWASWHLPMFFVPGSNQHGSSFFKYVFALTAWSLFMTMLYYQTNGSILLCMIFHAAANVWAFITNVPKDAERFELLFYVPIIVIAIAMLPL